MLISRLIQPALTVFLLMFGILHFAAADSNSEALDLCFKKVLSQTKLHRIDREDSLKNCLDIHKSKLSKETCIKKVKNLSQIVHSGQLYNRMQNTCFYEAGQFKSLKNCVRTADIFQLANDHDDGVFYCYQIYQEKLSRTQCLAVANELIFPLKKDYLKRHCLTH